MHYFVSDDSYFLYGMKESLSERTDQGSHISLIHYGDIYPVFSPVPDDVVIIRIRDIHKRYRISGMEQLAHCRVIILLACAGFVTGPPDGAFPWILPWYMDTGSLKDCIDRAAAAPFHRQRIPKQDWMIFYYLSRGISTTVLADRMIMNGKYLYQLKRRKIIGYGLEGNDATVILAFRDIIRLSVVAG